MDIADGADPIVKENLVLLEVRARQIKRAAAERQEVQEQLPSCRSNLVKRQKKGTAGTTPRSGEQSIPKRQDRRPTAQLFAACKCNSPEAGGASPDSAVQLAAVQQQRQKMRELLQAL